MVTYRDLGNPQSSPRAFYDHFDRPSICRFPQPEFNQRPVVCRPEWSEVGETDAAERYEDLDDFSFDDLGAIEEDGADGAGSYAGVLPDPEQDSDNPLVDDQDLDEDVDPDDEQ